MSRRNRNRRDLRYRGRWEPPLSGIVSATVSGVTDIDVVFDTAVSMHAFDPNINDTTGGACTGVDQTSATELKFHFTNPTLLGSTLTFPPYSPTVRNARGGYASPVPVVTV